nr:hypothetical protein CFP56_34995 [Quercus suber]
MRWRPKLNWPPLAVPQWWWPKLSLLPPWYSRIHHTVPSSKSIPILAGSLMPLISSRLCPLRVSLRVEF